MSDESLRRDEIVSAYLDGEATPVRDCRGRGGQRPCWPGSKQLRAVRDAIAAPVPSAVLRNSATSCSAQPSGCSRCGSRRPPGSQDRAPCANPKPLLPGGGCGRPLARGGRQRWPDRQQGRRRRRHDRASAALRLWLTPAAPAEMAAGAAEEPTAELDMETVDDAMPADEAMPEQEPMAEEAMEEPAEYAEAEEPEPAPTAPSPTTTIAVSAADDGEAAAAEAAAAEEVAAAEPETDDPRDTEYTSGDSSAEVSDTASQAVDLGTLDDLETFLHGVARHWQAQDADDAALTKPGECSASLQDRVLELNGEVLQSFVAIVGVEDPVTINAELARRDDGTAFIVYAAGPDCETEIQELAELPAP